MQDIIKILKKHEANELNKWYELDEATKEKFIRDIALFARQNEATIIAYCQSVIPSYFSTLSIVYEALSKDDARWNHFLFDEIIRVNELIKRKKIPIQTLEVLSDIDAENIYKEQSLYVELINYLVAQLNPNYTDNYIIAVLDLLDWYLMELFIEDQIAEANHWYSKIKNIHDQTVNKNVKRLAIESMMHLEELIKVERPSVMQSLRDFFDQNSSLS